MALVVPTVLASTPDEYTVMIERARCLSRRVHVDICDGEFAKTTTIGLAQVHVPDGTEMDLHLMMQDPQAQMETALSLHPNLIIFHAESSPDIHGSMRYAHDMGIKVGVALLPTTTVEAARQLIELADHVLIFTGTLGQNGGEFHGEQLAKSAQIRAIKPGIEISVDGGVTSDNSTQVVEHDVDILYVGAFLQTAKDPQGAYDLLSRQAIVGLHD